MARLSTIATNESLSDKKKTQGRKEDVTTKEEKADNKQ